MGIYGRDYMRDDKRPGLGLARLSVNTRLIIANVLLWFLFAGSLSWSGGQGGLGLFITEWLLLHPADVVGKLRLWEPFTAIWFHDPNGLGHILFNMLFLYFFGRHTEALLGRGPYLRLYLTAGVVGCLAYVGLAMITGNHHPALGASGAIYGVGVYLALRQPHLQVIFFIVRMPLWVLVGVFMVGRELVNLIVLRHAFDGTIAHLAGAATGLVFFRLWRHGAPERPGLAARWKAATDQRRAEREAGTATHAKERVDELLEKIHREGIGALTDAEKNELERASKGYRR